MLLKIVNAKSAYKIVLKYFSYQFPIISKSLSFQRKLSIYMLISFPCLYILFPCLTYKYLLKFAQQLREVIKIYSRKQFTYYNSIQFQAFVGFLEEKLLFLFRYYVVLWARKLFTFVLGCNSVSHMIHSCCINNRTILANTTKAFKRLIKK